MQFEKSLASVAFFAKPEQFEDLRRNVTVRLATSGGDRAGGTPWQA
jgi:hypothetical protein